MVEINIHKSTNTSATGSSNSTVSAVNDTVVQTRNNILNRPFTTSEITTTIKSRKNKQ